MDRLNPQPDDEPTVLRRVIVVGLVQNEKNEILICKMPQERGVFPGQWGLPGGGMEEGERMETALRRELREELGIEVSQVEPLFFTDGQYNKLFPDGSRREIYMIFLIFSCRAALHEIKLSPEFEDYAWVDQQALIGCDLNAATVETFRRLGWINEYNLQK